MSDIIKVQCNCCNKETFHTFLGNQYDENDNYAFTLYNCSECHTTKAIKLEVEDASKKI